MLAAGVTDFGGRDFCCWKQEDCSNVVEDAPYLPKALYQENQKPCHEKVAAGATIFDHRSAPSLSSLGTMAANGRDVEETGLT